MRTVGTEMNDLTDLEPAEEPMLARSFECPSLLPFCRPEQAPEQK
jgi:hypothetical protein